MIVLLKFIMNILQRFKYTQPCFYFAILTEERKERMFIYKIRYWNSFRY